MNTPTPYQLGEAAGLLHKSAGDSTVSYSLTGTLYFTPKGWGLLSVPNALVRGAFDALHEIGAELPFNSAGRLNGHISAIRPEELKSITDKGTLAEAGHQYRYTLGPLKEIVPDWDGMSRVWAIEVRSPDIEKLRKSYGLSALPNDGKYALHITIARRKVNVLRNNEVVKQSDVRVGSKCPHCGSTNTHGARAMEKHPDGRWSHANTVCGDCVNGFSVDIETGATSTLDTNPERDRSKRYKEGAYGPPYRCETCCKAFAQFPDGIDKCTACSGDLIPEQTFREKWPDRDVKSAGVLDGLLAAGRQFKLADLLSGGPLTLTPPGDEDRELETPEEKRKKKKKGLSPWLVGGALGAAALGGGALGIGALRRRADQNQPTASPAAAVADKKPSRYVPPLAPQADLVTPQPDSPPVREATAGVGIRAARASGVPVGYDLGAQVTGGYHTYMRKGVGSTAQGGRAVSPVVRLTSGMTTDAPTNAYDARNGEPVGGSETALYDRDLAKALSPYVDRHGVINSAALGRAPWWIQRQYADAVAGNNPAEIRGQKELPRFVLDERLPHMQGPDVNVDASPYWLEHGGKIRYGKVPFTTPLGPFEKGGELDPSHPNYPQPSALQSLLQAQQHSDRHDYRAKHRILAQLLRQSPQDFAVDQNAADYPGITHLPTGFQTHAPFSLATMATGKMPKTAGTLRGLLRCQSTGTDYPSPPKEANAMSQQERVRLLMPTPTGHLMELFDNPKYPDNLGKFRFPGGGVEPGETHEQAAVREAKEELGVDLSGKTFRYVGADHRPEYANEHYLAVDDHGVSPGSFADAANPGSKVTLFDGRPEGEKYIGPDLSKLVPRTVAKEASAKTRLLTSVLKPKPPVPKLPAPAPKPTAGPLKPAPTTPATPAPAPKPIPPPVTTPTPLTPPTSIAPATTTATAPVTLAPKPGLLGRAAAVPANVVKNQLGFGYKGPLQGVNPFKPTASRFVPRPTMAQGRALNPLAWGQYGVHRLARGLGQTAGGRAFGTLGRSARHALTTSPVRSVADAVLPGSGRFAAPLVTGALSAPVAYAGYRAQRALPDAADEELQQVGVPEDVRNDQWWRTWGTQPKMLYHGLAPTWAGGDDTRIGRLPGHYLKHVVEDTPRDLAGKELNVHEPTAADALKAPGRYLPTPSTLAKQTVLKNVEDNLVDGQPAVLKATAKDVAADLRSDAPKTTPLQALRDPRKALADEAAWLERTKAELDRSPIVSDLVESVDPRVYNTPGALEAIVKKYTGDSSNLVADAVRHQAEMRGVAPPVKGMKFLDGFYYGLTPEGRGVGYSPKTRAWAVEDPRDPDSHYKRVPGPPPVVLPLGTK